MVRVVLLSSWMLLWLVPRVTSTHAVPQQQQQLRGGGGGGGTAESPPPARRTLLLLPDAIPGDMDTDNDGTATAAATTTTENKTDASTTCGGLRATICALPEFETLCGLFHRLEEEEENGLEFLGHVGTFFAPTNQALEQLPSRWAVQLETNRTALLNILQYHAVRTSVTPTGEDAGDVDEEDKEDPTKNSTTTAMADGGGGVYLVDDFECDSEWLMMNNQTTKTWCVTNPDFGKDETKIQLGDGNLAARTLPTILLPADDPAGSSISRRTCDRTAILHQIDQVILPAELVFDDALPRRPSSAPEDGVATTVPLLPVDNDDNSTTIMGRQDNSNTNNDNNSNSSSSSTTNNNCGGIHDTVCAQSQLTQLCALFEQLDLDEESDSTRLDFLNSTATFFAPMNSAFLALPATLVSDLQQPQVLAQVLQYHAVRMRPPSSSDAEDDDTEDGSVFLFWDELTCDQELRMQNNVTTKTLCLNRKKIQLGSGNMALRTLPTILPPPPTTADSSGETPTTTTTSLLTCDHQAIIHLVDQVILPELPLTTTTTSGDNPNSSNSTRASQKEEETVGTLEGTDEVEDPVMSEDETPCPMVPPDIVASTAVCFTIGQHCGYGRHVYTGCTWRDLHCSPTTECVCLGNTDNNNTTTGSLSSWECTNTIGTFPVCDDDGASTSTTSSSSSLDRRASVPRNEDCNPDDPLPEPPRLVAPPNADDTTALAMAGRGPPIDEREPPPALSWDCPDAIEAGTSCSGTYVSQLVCHYNYIWFGCSVQELDCAPVHECECNPFPFEDGNWACRSFTPPNCPAATTPTNLPWGQYCNNN